MELYYLDAKTKDNEFRITTFSYRLEDLVKDFAQWMKAQELRMPDISYAKVFDSYSVAVAELLTDEDGVVFLCPLTPTTKDKLKRRILNVTRRFTDKW